MEPMRLPTEEEIRAVYQQGADATVDMVGKLIEAVKILAERIQK